METMYYFAVFYLYQDYDGELMTSQIKHKCSQIFPDRNTLNDEITNQPYWGDKSLIGVTGVSPISEEVYLNL